MNHVVVQTLVAAGVVAMVTWVVMDLWMLRDVGNMLKMLKNTKEITRGCWAMSGKLQKTFRNFFGGDNERC